MFYSALKLLIFPVSSGEKRTPQIVKRQVSKNQEKFIFTRE